MALFSLAPAIIIFCFGVTYLVSFTKRHDIAATLLLPSFLRHVFGWGFFTMTPALVVILLATTLLERSQGMLIVLAPWAFAAGEIVGLIRFQNKHKAANWRRFYGDALSNPKQQDKPR